MERPPALFSGIPLQFFRGIEADPINLQRRTHSCVYNFANKELSTRRKQVKGNTEGEGKGQVGEQHR